MGTVVNDDLRKERQRCNFNIEELTNLLDNGEKHTKERRSLENKILSTSGLLDVIPEEYLTYKERYQNTIRKVVLMYKTLQSVEDPNKTFEEKIRSNFRNSVVAAVFKENSPIMIHFAMFIPTILSQADDKQRNYWLKRAENMEILGTYAQTELGHGSFMEGIETQASYDEEREEFVLHSPTLTAYKWWPGGLGHTANYCIVMANLFIRGKNYGIQPFLVQIRDAETHMPLSGIKLGEIGAKLGHNSVNNGFLGFEHHRIARDRMLMRNAQVLKDGTFKASPNSKLAYGTVVLARVVVINLAASYLARAVTIAVRYSAVRRQSQIKSNEPEVQVLDFVTQQHKIFVGIASSHAFLFAVYWLWDLYCKYTHDLGARNLERLPELHALSCALKVLSSSECTTLIESCRRSCGGHGFMLSANFPKLHAAATAYGDNTVLLLQVAKSLIKAWNKISKSQPVSASMAYLADKTPTPDWDNSVDGIIKSFQKVAIGKLSASATNLKYHINVGRLTAEEAWNKTSIQLAGAAEAHARVILMSVYKSEVEKQLTSLSPPLQTLLQALVELYSIYWTLEKTGDLLMFTKLSQRDVLLLQQRYEDLLEIIRPNAVGLVDAFDFRDEVLNSTLGAQDGRVYERLMEEALKSPLNQQPVDDSFHKYLKPFMKGKL